MKRYEISDGHYQNQTHCKKTGLAVATPQKQHCLCGQGTACV